MSRYVINMRHFCPSEWIQVECYCWEQRKNARSPVKLVVNIRIIDTWNWSISIRFSTKQGHVCFIVTCLSSIVSHTWTLTCNIKKTGDDELNKWKYYLGYKFAFII